VTETAESPQTWHYGLIARWWAEFNESDPEELAFYRGCIERFGQPALDVACGTGRLLVPLLAAGVDVDGIDLSDDMLAFARDAAQQRGYQPRLLRQAMGELEPPRTYRTVYICDSFGIGGRRADDQTMLRRIHDVLEPGGALVFSHDLPHDDPAQWAYWLPDRRRELPQPWSEGGDRRRAANGEEIELGGRIFDLDPSSQVVTMQMRPRLYRDGALVSEEEHTIRIALYFRQELLAMLADAGFRSVEVQAPYAGRAATADDTSLVFIARRNGAAVT